MSLKSPIRAPDRTLSSCESRCQGGVQELWGPHRRPHSLLFLCRQTRGADLRSQAVRKKQKLRVGNKSSEMVTKNPAALVSQTLPDQSRYGLKTR